MTNTDSEKSRVEIIHEFDIDGNEFYWIVRYTNDGWEHYVWCETEAEALEYERFFLEEFEELEKNILEDMNEQHNKKGERS